MSVDSHHCELDRFASTKQMGQTTPRRHSKFRLLLLLSFISHTFTSATPLNLNISYWSSSLPPTGSIYAPRLRFNAVIDSHDRIFLLDGFSSTGATNDVWMSVDSGGHWSCQNCAAASNIKYPPRYWAATAVDQDTLYISGGTATGSTALTDLWSSNDQGQTWIQIASQVGWPTPLWTSDNYLRMHFDRSGQHNLYVLTSGALFQAKSSNNYQTWTNISLATFPPRVWPGTIVTQDNHLLVAGGQAVPSYNLMNDVWSFDLNSPAAGWTQLTSAASWTGRSSPQLCQDSQQTIWIFGQEINVPVPGVPDLLYSSQNGASWTRADDSTKCSLSYPWSVVPDSDSFSVVCDSSDRLLIVGGGVKYEEQPTGDARTAFIQLGDSSTRTVNNLANGDVSFSSCNPASSSTGTGQPSNDPSKPDVGLSWGELFGILIGVLAFFGFIIFAYMKWGRRLISQQDDELIRRRVVAGERSNYRPPLHSDEFASVN